MRFCIIGLGNFGTNLARQLSRDGHEVVAVDNNPAHTDAMKEELEFLITADCTDINVFEEIPITECDAVIIAIGESFEANLSIAANVQQTGAKRIICRVVNALHARLLKLLKIDELLIPEAMAAAWLARSLRTPDLLDSLYIGKNHEIAEVTIPPQLIGKTLLDANLRNQYELNLVTILKRKTALSSTTIPQIEQVLGIPNPTRTFEESDILVLFGHEKNVRRFLNDHH